MASAKALGEMGRASEDMINSRWGVASRERP